MANSVDPDQTALEYMNLIMLYKSHQSKYNENYLSNLIYLTFVDLMRRLYRSSLFWVHAVCFYT